MLANLEGTFLADRFDVYEALGTGLVGRTYRAWDRLTEGPVAIKVLNKPFEYMPGLSGFAGAYPMASLLRRESRLMEQLQHPGICGYRSSGEINNAPWLAMEYIDGGRLRDRETPMLATQALHIARGLAGPLEYLHSAGYVHRDVTPSNIGFRSDGTAVLMDIGLAQRTHQSPETAIQRVMGSPGYSPPECHRPTAFDIDLTPRADVFSLGRLVEWMLHGSDMRANPRLPMPDGHAPISKVIERATRVDPRKRYADIPELLRACELALG